jgi:quinoprotein glucose dehydrogenase
MSLLVMTSGALAGEPGKDRTSGDFKPVVRPASKDAAQAITRMRVPKGMKIELAAAEPELANPVAFCFDEKGRILVAETFRHHEGVTDIRGHMDWLDEDLACRTVQDRIDMMNRRLGKDAPSHARAMDRVRLLEDVNRDGVFEKGTVFADDFRNLADGIGAGLFARRGKVWFTCIPDLWLLQDTNGDGRAERRDSLSTGYGIHVGFLGHDLHGVTQGPDGRLYFSIGDRGLNVPLPNGKRIDLAGTGSVLRCEPDGSKLEVFAFGLRNPQELAFDEFGNLFTGDNNCDSGDKARWVHLVEGGDSGWRFGYQFHDRFGARGPWNAEKLWHTAHEGQAAYLLPPLAHVGDGPSGLTYATGLGMPAEFRKAFFLCDFRGTAGTSGVRAVQLKPRGASFEVTSSEPFFWSVLATDCDFGPDGNLHVTDWVEGWDKPGRGRIYRVRPEGRSAEVEKLLAEVPSLIESAPKLPNERLLTLLAHPDRRVRQEAHLALAERGDTEASLAEVARGKVRLEVAAVDGWSADELRRLARIHAIWALGIQRRQGRYRADRLTSLLPDPDEEIQAQAAKMLGDAGAIASSPALAELLARTKSDRVRLHTLLALGRAGFDNAKEPVLAAVRGGIDRDPYLRHAAAFAVARLFTDPEIARLAGDSSRSVRMVGVLAARRLGDRGAAAVTPYLKDADARIVEEAARAINDVPIIDARAALAATPISADSSPVLARRVINANRSDEAGARRLVGFVDRADLPKAWRLEAIEILREWNSADRKDHITGEWRPGGRVRGAEAVAFERINDWIASDDAEIASAACTLAAKTPIGRWEQALLARAAQGPRNPAGLRIAAMKALREMKRPSLATAVRAGLVDQDESLRIESRSLLAELEPKEAASLLARAIESGAVHERQESIRTLGRLKTPEAATALAGWLDRLLAGTAPAELSLDLLEAAGERSETDLKAKLTAFDLKRAKSDHLSGWRECLTGGDADAGRKVFLESTAAACLRCHKVDGKGGEVGPDLSGIGAQKTREYLLEALVEPNRQIAKGFDTVIVEKSDGTLISGIVRAETAEKLTLINAEAKIIEVPKSEIESRRSGRSAMPDDLIKKVSKRDIRDLVEFLSKRTATK